MIEPKDNRWTIYYFCLCSFMVLCMVAIGGITRLTGSGLSITEWKPITGIIPPITDHDWSIEFLKYQSSPEFVKINNTINMDSFKKIYLLEYFHRIAARATGLVFVFGGIFLWASGYLSSTSKKVTITSWFLILLQGIMGWYMVKSGLANNPYVSHFRLSAHLLLALFLYIMLLNHAARIYFATGAFNKPQPLYFLLIGTLVMQIFLGGLVAGLKAGLIYNSFPLMGDYIIPEEIFQNSFAHYLSDPGCVQFWHRVCAYILSLLIIFASIDLVKKRCSGVAIALIVILSLQFALGVYTLVYNVPILSAWIHQFVAFILAGMVILSSIKSQITTNAK